MNRQNLYASKIYFSNKLVFKSHIELVHQIVIFT